MILMDLKRVELAGYNGLPHLLVPVITEPERAKAALKWAVGEMENRYRRFAGATARNIKAFNETRVDPADRLPYIVIVIDELADLMMREGKNVEDPIVRLAQKARATGIHMVLATQRPSVNVVTGLIKANFPSRIAFAMASQIDSRTILDSPGAEDLIGRGDMLYQPSDLPRPMRLQGVFVSDPEIGRVTEYWRDQIDGPALRPVDHHLATRSPRGPWTTSPTTTPTDCSRTRSASFGSTIAPRRRCSSGGSRSATPGRRGSSTSSRRGGTSARSTARTPAWSCAATTARRPDGGRGRRMTTRDEAADGPALRRARRRPRLRGGGGPVAAGAPAGGARAQGRGPVPRRARHEDPRPLPRGARARRVRASCPARSTPRASCATTRCTWGSTPRTSSASGSGSAATRQVPAEPVLAVPKPARRARARA